LRPGGLLILQAFTKKHFEINKEKRFGPPAIEHYIDASDLRREFGRDLLIFELKETDEEMQDGEHNGPASLVSMVATKSASSINY